MYSMQVCSVMIVPQHKQTNRLRRMIIQMTSTEHYADTNAISRHQDRLTQAVLIR